jgi:hypothetical protein
MVLPAFSMLTCIGLFFRKLENRKLKRICILSFVFCPIFMVIGESLLPGAAILADIAGGPLSAVGMLPVFLTGMLIGRSELSFERDAGKFLVSGIVLVALMQLMNRSILSAIEPKIEGIMAGLPMYQNVQEIDQYAAWPLNTTPPCFTGYLSWHRRMVLCLHCFSGLALRSS